MRHGDIKEDLELEAIRNRIDALDEEILSLLKKRGNLAALAGKTKAERNLPVYDPARERALLERLTRWDPAPFSPEAIQGVFREIIKACRSLEQPTRVAFLGPLASFSHQASLERYGPGNIYQPLGSIEEVFEAVERGWADVGIVPVENAIEGGVAPTLDKLAHSRTYVIEERVIPIDLALLSEDPNMESIQEVCSHPQALGQCRQWLMKNLPQATLLPTESTAQAAKMAKSRKGVAAVASTLAAELYDLKVLQNNIEDAPFNQTRFFVVGKRMAPKSGNDKTSVLIKIKDEPGALFRIVQPFAIRGINLTKIESRPSRSEPFSYVFFVDFLGHIEDEPIQEVLKELSSVTMGLKVLGSYPRA